MKSILKTACSAGVGLLIVGGSILGAQGAMAADEPDSPSTTSSGGVSSVRSTEDLDGQVSTRGYLGRATQTAATGVTPGSEIKEGAIVQLVNDEQIDGVY